ncbi:MAG: DNA internalization-related competence protein ComEC/Rec2 [Bacteroidetes bacterium]|nr:DNA internalization-related competence protein ComEC/Rec2 [Bacteroidota bacterium]MBU1114429.1 DNA internalization-related competence protein ComEC/Rec2 [Bacteroidota bacterium]MBU1798832.1 DNA internalization-related competence protein ComEC/Rec2 [Bacteroidota bacterium]
MKNYPLIKYVIAFVVGIIGEKYLLIQIPYSISIIIILTLLAVFFHFKKNNYMLIIVLLINSMLFGATYSILRNNGDVQYPFQQTKISGTEIYGEIKNIELLHNDEFKLLVQSDSVIVHDSTTFIKSKFQCNISSDSYNKLVRLYSSLDIGNKVKLVGTLRKAKGECNPGEFDYYKYLQSKDVVGIIYIREIKDVNIIESSVNIFHNLIFEGRKWIASKINISHNAKTASLLKGLLLADRSEIDYETKESFINSGVIHVLAVSGLHVGFIVLIFMFLFSRLSIYPRTFLIIIGLIGFLLITNSPASVFRATIMIVVMFLIYLSNRNYNSVNALAIAALILLLINPNEIFNPGFQLSFSAVLSILVVYPILSEKITTQNKFLKYLMLFCAVSFSAQIGTLPFTLMYFQKLSIISLFANFLVIPLIAIIVGLGVLTISVSTISSLFALYYGSANMLVTDLLLMIVDITGNLKYSFLYIPNFSFLDGIIFYLFFSIIIYSIKEFTNIYATLILFLFVGLNLFYFLQIDDRQLLPDGLLSVVMIDIGQGDGILVKFPNNKIALIDAGNASLEFDNGERVIAPLLRRFSIKQIDYGFISHVDSDHYKGFLSLIKNGWIKEIYKPKIDTSQKKDVDLEKIIYENNVKLNYYSKKKMIFGNLALYILNDTTNSEYKHFDSNNQSGVIKIVHGKNTFLLVGDAEKESERLLIANYGKFLDSDILKIGHHGSKSSSSQIFIDAVTPSVGLISAGQNNSFGHPTKMIVDRFTKSKVKLYRTDIEGAIILQSNGETVRKVNWRQF